MLARWARASLDTRHCHWTWIHEIGLFFSRGGAFGYFQGGAIGEALAFFFFYKGEN